MFDAVRGEPVEPLCFHRVDPSTGSGRTVLNIAGLILTRRLIVTDQEHDQDHFDSAQWPEPGISGHWAAQRVGVS